MLGKGQKYFQEQQFAKNSNTDEELFSFENSNSGFVIDSNKVDL